MTTRVRQLLVLVSFAVACGSEEPPQPAAATPSETSSGAESPRAPSGGMQVEGILGKISERRIEDTMSSKLPAFQRCFFNGMSEVELLSGAFKFSFRVGLDGTVEWVFARESSVGHRATERCLLQVAEKTRFPKPEGGPAEFAWGFEIDPQSGVRAPVEWKADRVIENVLAQRASLDACELGNSRFAVTAYVSPGGSVSAAGAATDSQDAASKIDCVVDAVRAWNMPDPGSYAAKVSFEL